jgi:predicted transcriptional regulator
MHYTHYTQLLEVTRAIISSYVVKKEEERFINYLSRTGLRQDKYRPGFQGAIHEGTINETDVGAYQHSRG